VPFIGNIYKKNRNTGLYVKLRAVLLEVYLMHLTKRWTVYVPQHAILRLHLTRKHASLEGCTGMFSLVKYYRFYALERVIEG
jgi:hypothetical protein